MSATLERRGPDGVGYFETGAASLTSRRLSVIDHATGTQPMATADGRLHMVYNGEVYNFRELRTELEALGHQFRSRSDTEVVLEAYAEWGTDAFRRFNGMWGLAILDERDEQPRLVLCRDHFGIKPLYVARWAGRVVFASEIKAVVADPTFPRHVNEQAMSDYLEYGLFDHSDATFFEGINAVPAATVLEITADGERATRYWEPTLTEDGPTDPAAFRTIFERAVARRMVSDVPVGTCLSGGLDSSSITTVLAQQLGAGAPDSGSLGRHLQTFSAVFPGDPIDETGYIDDVVAATHAESHRLTPSHADMVEELEDWVWQVEMPMVSTAPFAMRSVMRMASEHVTVLIDGQGGDELLGGYDVYPYVYLRELLHKRHLRQFLVEAVRWRSVVGPLVVQRLLAMIRRTSDADLLRPAFRRAHQPPEDLRVVDDLKQRLAQDLTVYSLPPLLRYEDRISMAYSVETRLPFLDQELVDAVMRLPTSALMDHGWSRRILREALRDVLPASVYRRRKKIGFTTPEFRWFQDEQVALQRIMHSPSFVARPYWNAPSIATAFAKACAGRRRRSLFFWRVINAEIWMRVSIDEGTRR